MANFDIPNFKDQVQTVLNDANTTTATTDLSGNLSTRIAKVLQVNPERIPIASTWHSFVTCYIESKEINHPSFNQQQHKVLRNCVINLQIVGAVYNSLLSARDEDSADEDCEALMENIEEILRENPTIKGTVRNTSYEETTFHNRTLDDGANLRYGIVTVKCMADYTLPKAVPTGLTNTKSGSFDGSSYSEHGDIATMAGLSEFTLSVFFKTSASGITRVLFGQWDNSGANQDAILVSMSQNAPAGTLQFTATETGSYGGGKTKHFKFTTVINDGDWHHGVFIFDGSGSGDLLLYLDGTLDPVHTKWKDETINALANSTKEVSVGAVERTGPGFENYYSGLIDEMAAFKVALTSSERSELVDGTAPGNIANHSQVANNFLWLRFEDDLTDSSSEGNNGTNNGITFSTDVPT
jgi:hypothetical protein